MTTAIVNPQFRLAIQAEAASLSAFAVQCFRDTYAPVCRPMDVEVYLQSHLTPVLFEDAIVQPGSWVIQGLSDNDRICYAHCRLAEIPIEEGAKTDSARTLEVARFYVTREWHGKGIAQQLMRQVLALGIQVHARSIWLSSWQENARANAFYGKEGFSRAGTATFLMGTQLQQDFILQRAVAHTP